MVDSKSKDDKSKEADTRDAAKPFVGRNSIFEIAEENSARLIDEIIKIQPHYTQAISNLQSEYVQSNKKIIEASFRVQKHLLGTNIFNWSNTPLITLYIQQLDTMANNMIRSLDTNNQLIIDALEAAGNYLKAYDNIVKVVAELSSNDVTSWNSFLYTQQQRFFK